MLRSLALAATLLIPAAAQAAVVSPTSYMYYAAPNSSGSAYEDDTYNGTLGQLADGISATTDWQPTDGFGAPGPNVGWLNVNPLILFSFDTVYQFSELVLNLQDGKGIAGVGLADSITVNGLTSPMLTGNGTAFSGAWDVTMDISSLAPTSTLMVEVHRGFQWTFLSEFTFSTAEATAEVPLPAGLPLLLAGLGGLALIRRRKS
ncbi:VPLPA-CTERM sorting domain-containing protein [Pacificoceanicola onchidii]|uniref:VPLPA-CTERM sorting domain-containing protein n=1 Tax=Pacificoceanicola onchidii TaxID=2562685 RepID=UPI0010A657BD|nr:VPLPA-CTERM sorting domain-containing protein [Pacificoceanicola onchidii]